MVFVCNKRALIRLCCIDASDLLSGTRSMVKKDDLAEDAGSALLGGIVAVSRDRSPFMHA